jgi:hypothetical protein
VQRTRADRERRDTYHRTVRSDLEHVYGFDRVEGECRVPRGRELVDALAERLVAENMDVRRRALCRRERKQPAVDGQVDVCVAMNGGREEREDNHGEAYARPVCPSS